MYIFTTNEIIKCSQISESIPLVGDLEDISSLNREYANDEIYLAKVRDLSKKYSHVRRTRPDGNCFFRAFSYAYIEKLLEDKGRFNLFFELAERSKEGLVSLGFPQFTVEDFYDTVSKYLGDTFLYILSACY